MVGVGFARQRPPPEKETGCPRIGSEVFDVVGALAISDPATLDRDPPLDNPLAVLVL